MNLTFEQLVISNFGSFGKAQKLKLVPSFGLHYVKGINKAEPRLGPNGCGKSTIFNALCWCLYGKTINGLRNPDIQPWSGKKATTVSTIVRLDDQPHNITRTTHPNRLTINGKESGQDKLVNLIGLDFSTFANTLMLGQGEPLFFDRSPREKMALFSEVLLLDRWEARSKFAADRVTTLAMKESKIAGQLSSAEASQTQIVKMLSGVKQQSDEWEKTAAERARTYEKQLKALTKSLEAKHERMAKADLAYDGAMVEVKHYTDQITQLTEYLDIACRDRTAHEIRIEANKASIVKLTRELKTPANRCPLCGQKIKADEYAEHKAEIQQRLGELSKKLKVPKALLSTISDLEKQLTDARKHIQTFQDKAAVARDELDRAKPEYTQVQFEIKHLQKESEALINQQNPHADQIHKLRRDNKVLKKQIEDFQKDLVKLSRTIARTKFWVKGFKDVRLYIIEEVLDELQLVTNAMLDGIGLVGWEIQYAIEKETKSGTTQSGLNVTILSPKNRKPVHFKSWSGGEGQRLRLIGALALSEVLLSRAGVITNFEVLDEPTKGVSREGIADLVDFLSERAKQLQRATWFVDHHVIESAKFASVLTVTIDQQGSRLC